MMEDIADYKKTKGAAPREESAPSQIQQANDTKPSKWRTTLRHLLSGPRHRFQAETFGDHALHSTVSALKRDFGIEVSRDWIEVPNRFGTRTRVKRYWIAEQSRALALQILTGKKRGEGAA